MATVESLDIQIAASFRTAASAIDDLNTRLGRTATSLSSIGTNLQRQLSPMTSATRSLNQAFNSGNTSIGKVKKSSESLSSTFAKLYSKIYLLRKGFSMFKNAVQSSMDFVEIYNYFNSAFIQVSSRAADEWQEAGYSSAEAYVKSFRERAEELTTKMTGFKINENGTLKNANIQNFGMDPSQLMNYQAMFAQMSSSMGNSSETAVKLSNALTMIGADLASVKNMDFTKTWNDMASGLAGMSRTLDKYGVNIRNVNLQERMHQAGIEGSITKLNQENKALLRAIILLESTEYAWADLGLTLSQPANQMRLMQANFSNLGRTIGNIFLPYVAAAIKYISGFTIALQRLLEPIAAIVAAKFPDFNWGGSKGENEFLSNILDESGEIDDNFDKAAKSAKKFQNQLLGFDEAYKLSEPSDSDKVTAGDGSGIDTSLLEAEFDSIYDKYKAVWEEAYKNAENPANEIANRIINAFKSGDYKGIGTYISTNISDALASINWDSVYQGARNFGTGLAEFMNGLITPDLFGNVVKTIAGALNTKLYTILSFGQTFDFTNLGESIAAGVNNFFATFDFGSLSETLNVWAKGLFGTLTSAIANIDWLQVYDKMIEFLENIDIGTIAIVIGAISIKKIKKAILAQGVISWIGSALTKLVVGVPLVLSNIKILAGGGLIAETGFISKLANALALAAGGAGTLHEALVAVFGVVGTTVAGIASVVGGIALAFTNFFSMLKDGFSWLKEILMVVGIALAAVGAVILGAPALVAGVIAGIVAAVGTAVVLIKDNWEAISKFFSGVWEGIKDIFSSVGNFFSSVFTSAVNGIKNAWSGIKNFFSDIWNGIKNTFSSVGSWFGNIFDTAANGVKNAWSSITGFFGNIWTEIKNAFGDVAGWFKNVFTDAWQGVKNVFSTGGKIFDGIKDGIASVFKTVVNGLIGGINKVIAFPFNKINGMLNSIRDISILGIEPFKGLWEKNPLSVPQIPKLAKGAVIKGGSPFMAILGDQPRGMTNIEAPLDTIRQAVQMELDNVGSYGGYGDDYLQQMKQAAYEGVLQAIRDAGGIRAEATFRVENDKDSIFKVTQEKARDYLRQTGKDAYVF